MISRSVEYALRAVICLAVNQHKELTVNEIAKMVHVPPSYLSKILQSLAKKKIVTSRRGKLGGFALACQPSELTILNIINAVDPLKRIETCFLESQKEETDLCALQICVNDVISTVEAKFNNVRIADLT